LIETILAQVISLGNKIPCKNPSKNEALICVLSDFFIYGQYLVPVEKL